MYRGGPVQLSLCIHSQWTYFVFLQAFAVITGDAVQLRMHVPFRIVLDISLGVGLLDHRFLISSFKGICILFCVRT